jgi:GDP-mannose 6-dehydrogenase
MQISVFGLGYVGAVTAASLAADGHEVVGVDVNAAKVDLINAGDSPIGEAGLAELIAAGVKGGRLRATTRARDAVAATAVSFVCVGTPSAPNGSLDTSYVARVAAEIGEALRDSEAFHTVVVRSTLLPGSTEGIVLPAIERTSGKQAGRGFGLAYNPEFLREGSAVADFLRPPKTVIGELDARAGDTVAGLFAALDAPLVRTQIRTAELVKYADNAFHALKVAFANEIGALCHEEGIDSHRLMDIFCLDTKLNISPAYLRPGFAFGGSCLPKDLRALTHRARTRDVAAPVLEAVLASNEAHKRRALEMVRATGMKRVAVLGFSFKDGTDDLRESPTVELVETLLGKGYDIRVYDHNVSLQRLIGANKAYIEQEIPHLSSLLASSLDGAVEGAEVVVVTTRDPDFARLPAIVTNSQIVIDLARAIPEPAALGERYRGIGW